MQNWQKDRNFKKSRNADGTFTYIITVDSEKVEVSEEIYEAYASIGYKMERMEFSIKNNRVLQDAKGLAVRDENGNPVMLPEREVSLDKLVDDDWDFASSEPSPEDALLAADESEIDRLRHCTGLLTEDEQALIKALFFEEKTEREYAETLGISKTALHARKVKVLAKMKNLMEQ